MSSCPTCGRKVAVTSHLPWEPIERAVRNGRPRCTGGNCPACHGIPDLSGVECGTCKSIGEALGISERSVTRYRADGRFPARHADAFAVRIGRHPIEIWGVEWEQSEDAA